MDFSGAQTLMAEILITDATLLKTDNAEQSTTVSRNQLNELPLPFGVGRVGAGSSAVREAGPWCRSRHHGK